MQTPDDIEKEENDESSRLMNLVRNISVACLHPSGRSSITLHTGPRSGGFISAIATPQSPTELELSRRTFFRAT